MMSFLHPALLTSRCDCHHRRWRCQLSDPAIYCHRPAGHPWYQRHQLPPADDQEQPIEGAHGQHTHYPETPTSPGVMSTDLQGVPGPVEA